MVKTINIPIDDALFDAIIKRKGGQTWKDFILGVEPSLPELSEEELRSKLQEKIEERDAHRAEILSKVDEYADKIIALENEITTLTSYRDAKIAVKERIISSNGSPSALERVNNMINETQAKIDALTIEKSKINEVLSNDAQ